jgi:hypothetical protein
MPLPCARCQTPLPKWELTSGDRAICTSCGSENTVRVFPALFAAETAARPEAAAEGEAACFDHPGKRAVGACRQCGRFVCDLCAVQFDGETWCPSCVAAGSGQARATNTETTRTLYDSVAVTIPLASFIFWPMTILTGPATVVYTLMKWRQPLSMVRRSRWRFIVAMLIGLAELGGWIWGILYYIARGRMATP